MNERHLLPKQLDCASAGSMPVARSDVRLFGQPARATLPPAAIWAILGAVALVVPITGGLIAGYLAPNQGFEIAADAGRVDGAEGAFASDVATRIWQGPMKSAGRPSSRPEPADATASSPLPGATPWPRPNPFRLAILNAGGPAPDPTITGSIGAPTRAAASADHDWPSGVPFFAWDGARPVDVPEADVIPGWQVVDVEAGGVILDGGAFGMFHVVTGQSLPDIGVVEQVYRGTSGWVVTTSRGIIVSR